LPLFPGAHAVRDALAAGATETGTTIHWVDAGVDTGAVIAQERVEILSGDTQESLHERIKIVERGLIVATIAELLPTLEKING
jgi:phosphoribosylglycinamide formyltransferase-1